ncbi:MAG: hypothetical protein LBU84_11885 [Prevotella sp.]|jgi:hypothetical protein|nr:hypothetical protein [Prevotella sp.]
MKKYIILLAVILISLNTTAQTFGYKSGDRNRKYKKENVVTDIRGDLLYENSDGVKASLSTYIFGNNVYKDNRNNEVTYSKEIWSDIFPEYKANGKRILIWLANAFYETKDIKEKYKRNIHRDLEYENNIGLKASLSKNIFDEGIYKDNQNNEIKYSKEYWTEILNDFDNKDVQVFFLMMDRCHDIKNFKEEYRIDIFGYQQYKDGSGRTASLSKDIFDKIIYKDSNGNKIEYTEDRWRRFIKRHKSEKKAFIDLVQENLSNN